MSCRHNRANGTCVRCYPSNPFGREDKDRVDPGPEEDYEPDMDGPGAVPAPRGAWTVVAVGDGIGVAKVTENVAGYVIDAARTPRSWADGRAAAQALNDAAGVSPDEAWRVVESSMAASRAGGTRWSPR